MDDATLNEHAHSMMRVVVIGVILLVTIAAFGLWQARPLHQWVQDRQAIGYLEDIELAMAEEEWSDARAFLSNAYELSPNHPEILRAAARLALAARSHEVFFFLSRLDDLGETNLDDRILACDASLQLEFLDRAEENIAGLLNEAPGNHDCLSLAVDIALAKEDYPGAITALGHLLNAHREDRERRLQLATLLIDEGNDSDQAIGWKYLWELAKSDHPIAPKAIDRLCNEENLVKPMLKNLVSLIENHPLAEETHQVRALQIRTQLYPHNRAQIIAEALKERESMSPHDAEELFRWLSNEGEYRLVLESLPLERARLSSRLMPIYLNALGRENRWAEAARILEDPRTPLAAPRRYIFAAYCAHKLGRDPLEVTALLQRALRAAKQYSDYIEALNAGKLAEDLALTEAALLAYNLAERDPRVADEALEGLVRITEQVGDAASLREITYRFVRRFPQRDDLYERYLYLNLLLGIEIESTLTEALRLIAAEPNRSAPRMIAALGFYRMNDFQAARKTCEPCKIETLDDIQQLIYAAVAANTGRDSLARRLLEQIDTTSLLKEEKKLIQTSQDSPANAASHTATSPRFRPSQAPALPDKL